MDDVSLWAIDRFEGEVAILEGPGKIIAFVPRTWLPGDAREAQVLRLTQVTESSRSISAITFRIDEDAQADRLREANEIIRNLPAGGEGDLDL